MTENAAPSKTDKPADKPSGERNPWIDWRRKRFWLLIALALYTLGGYYLAPWVIERQLTQTVADTGRSLSVEEIHTNPYLLTLDIQQLAIADSDGVELAGFDRFFADVQLSSLFRLALTFKTFSIDSPRLFDERFDGTNTRWVQFLADLAGEQSEPEAESGPPPVFLQQLLINNASVSVVDQTLEGYRADLGPITVRLANIRTQPDHVGSQTVELFLNETDRLYWEGDLQLIPLRSSGEVELRASQLPELRELLDFFLPFDIDLEDLDVRFNYRVAIEEGGLNAEVRDLQGYLLGFQATMDEGGPPVMGLERLDFSGGEAELPARTADLAATEVQGFFLNGALREDGSISLLDMIPERAENPAVPAAPVSTDPAAAAGELPPWVISLGRLSVTDSTVSLDDLTVSPTLEARIADITVEATAMDSLEGTRFPLSVSGRLLSGGAMRFEGAVVALPAPLVAGTINVDELETRLAQPYVNRFLNVELASGTLSLNGTIDHGPDQLLEAQGTLRYDNFELTDRLREERLAGWTSLVLDRFELDLAEETLATSELEFNELYGRVAIAEDRTTNVSDLLVTDGATASAPADAAAPDSDDPADPLAELPLAVTLGGIELSNTSLDFSDRSLPLPFSAEIREMNGDISALSSTSAAPAEIALEGRVNEFGLARINGSLVPFAPLDQTNITMLFRNLEMNRLTPYTVDFAGYAINEGRMDLDLGYRFENARMIGENSIIVRDIELGEKSDLPDVGSLPLGLAIALLKNSEGIIDLDVPVEGDLNNPEFAIGAVVMQAIGNLITRAVTAPFRLLGSLVGVDSEDFGTLTFLPGRADLSPPDREQLVKLAEAMLQRPELAVEVAGSWVEPADRLALQASSVEAAIEAWLTDNPGKDDELTTNRERRALEALTVMAAGDGAGKDLLETARLPFMQAPPGDPDAEPVLDELAYLASLREALEAAVPVGQDALESLANARAQGVIEGLQESQPEVPLNVELAAPQAVEAGDDGAIPLELSVTVND